MTEAELIRRSKAGDWDAFELLLEQYRAVLTRTAYLATRDRDAVQDVVQETLVQVWRDLPSFRPGSFKAWSIRILMNQARRYYRGKRVETVPLEAAQDIAGDGDGLEAALLQQEDAARLWQALAAVSDDHREILVLRYYADLTVPEIAKALSCPEGTVKSRLNRAIRNIEEVISNGMSAAQGGGL